MDKGICEINELSEDILNVSGIIYDMARGSNDEIMVKIRPIAELIYKKADKLCVKILEIIRD